MRRLRVSAFLADSIQQIHSLRASGEISSHAANACESQVSAFFRSGGTSCTTPLEIFFCDIDTLSFRKPERREDFLRSKGCGSFSHLAGPDAKVNSALDYLHCGRVPATRKLADLGPQIVQKSQIVEVSAPMWHIERSLRQGEVEPISVPWH